MQIRSPIALHYVSRHAFLQAIERRIHPDLVEQTILCGKVEHYGKNGIKFIKKGKRTIICVGEVKGDRIKIFTVEENNG